MHYPIPVRLPSLLFMSLLICFSLTDYGLAQITSVDEVIFYTLEWDGERDEYGRPLVPDDILERMEYVSLEEAWGTIRNRGYHNKYESGWEILHPNKVMIGRALTATFMPSSPELEERMRERGEEEYELLGAMNQWPIEMLEQGDVYVADGFGKVQWGTLIGENLGQAIYANSGNGPVFNAAARNLRGLRQIEGFNAWVKGWDPTYIQNMMLFSINAPARIGEAVVLPGDVVMAEEGGVLFIPPHLAERVVLGSEVSRLTDAFRMQRISEGVYRLEDTYGRQWNEEIEDDFYGWLEMNKTRLHEERGVGVETMETMIETRSRDWQQWIE